MTRSGEDVWVTGIGAVTSLGMSAAETWSAMLGGVNGVTEIDAPGSPVRIAAMFPHDPAGMMERTHARRLDRAEQAAVVTARQAWRDAGTPEVDPERLAVVVGTAVGGLNTTLAQYDLLRSAGARRVSPHTVPMLMPNGPAAWVSMELGALARTHAPVSACASGSEAIAAGLDLLRAGRADIVVAGGVEANVHVLTLTAFSRMLALSGDNDTPEKACRPFDRTRNGFVLGEGCALFVLERADHARARGISRPHGRILGAGVTGSAAHITASDVRGQVRALRQALRDADVGAADVGHVHAHATSTPLGDAAEAEAITTAIGTHPAVTATKSMTGHPLGASGALGAMAALFALRDGAIPPTRNLDDPDPGIPLDIVTDSPRTGNWDVAVANAFGFGGHNVSLVLAKT